MADLTKDNKLAIIGAGVAVAAAATVGLVLTWKHFHAQKSGGDVIGRPYNVDHTGHVGQYQVVPLIKALEGKKESKGDFTLNYFDIRGRAEPIRIVFHDTKTPFRDETPQNWTELKAQGAKDGTIPFGQMPYLRHGNFHLVESNAILRYLGRKLDRYGTSEEHRSLVDMFLDATESVRGKYLDFVYGQQGKEEAKPALLTRVTEYVTYLENWLSRDGKQKYLVGEEFTVADASVWELLEANLRLFPTLLDKHVHVKAWHERVANRPNIAAYLSSPARRTKVNANGVGQ
jgi:glutathione S-transferase